MPVRAAFAERVTGPSCQAPSTGSGFAERPRGRSARRSVRDVTGPGYEVAPAILLAAAAGMEGVARPVGVGALGAVPGDVGHAGLSSVFVQFCDRWEWGLRAVAERGADLAAELRAAAAAYRSADGG